MTGYDALKWRSYIWCLLDHIGKASSSHSGPPSVSIDSDEVHLRVESSAASPLHDYSYLAFFSKTVLCILIPLCRSDRAFCTDFTSNLWDARGSFRDHLLHLVALDSSPSAKPTAATARYGERRVHCGSVLHCLKKGKVDTFLYDSRHAMRSEERRNRQFNV